MSEPTPISKTRLDLQHFADVNGFFAILFWILAAVLVGDGGIFAWLAIVPFVLGWVGYGFAQYYHRRAWK